MNDIREAIHNAIIARIKEGYEPVAIILCAEANTHFVNALQDYHHTILRVETFENLPVFVVPDEPYSPGKDFWVKIAVKQ